LNYLTKTVDLSDFTIKVDKLFEKFNRLNTPGAAVLVQHQGKNIYKKCLGIANLEHQIPIRPETSFDLASVSKHLTSFGVLLLEKDGKLNINDDIHQYLSEIPDYNKKITIKNLIYQSSGLWEFWSILNKYSGFRNRDYFKITDVLNLLQHQQELIFNPGTKYAYTNTNYSLLAEIVKRITGVSFGEWTKENIFNPLEMENTYFQEDCKIPISNKATAYLKREKKYILARPSNVEIPGSAHAFTTLNDMAKWIDNLRTGKLGGKNVLKIMLTRGKLNNGKEISYAAGLIVSDYKGIEMIEHSGQTGGYKTMLVYCPEKELGIVILANERSINT
jgi:CubicO group peptidase (beta-lactamase class C family)